MEWDVAIIGGGASGLAAAVTAAEAGARTALFEADARVGRSILVSGNGRCNFSNAHIDVGEYHNAEFAGQVLVAFEAMARNGSAEALHGPSDGVDGTLSATRDDIDDAGSAEARANAPSALLCPNGVAAFFQDHGLIWREEAEGRLYPQANKASVVLDVLRASAAAAGAHVRCDAPVRTVEAPRKPGAPFTLRMADGQLQRARSVIAACGGRTAQTMLPDCLAYTDPEPLLGPIATDARFVRRLDKVRVRGSISLLRDGRAVAVEEGEIMFRRYGVSGIAAFNLSRLMRPGDQLSICMVPSSALARFAGGSEGAPLATRAARTRTLYGADATCEDLLRGMVLPQVSDVLCAYAGVQADTPADAQACDALERALTSFTLDVHGIGDEDVCQVRRGGFAVEGFDPATLQAREVPGLHVTGEALDVDGPCGGYNLHWAFATGIMAARAAAEGARR